MGRFTLLIFLLLHSNIYAEGFSISIETQRDYRILEGFLRFGIEQEEYGYVLEGDKPISIRTFYPLEQFIVHKDLFMTEEQFRQGLLAREAITVWKKCCVGQKTFVLKAVPYYVHGDSTSELGLEVSFINLPKLKQVIEENINLFRYILSPTINAAELAEKIAYSDKMITDILQDHRVLEGIVLGFGTHNSIVGGRMENVNALLISQDEAPLNIKGTALCDMETIYRPCYLRILGGDKSMITLRNTRFPFRPSTGFQNLKEELDAIEATTEPLPDSLITQVPRFVYGAYKGGELNQPFFEKLLKTQKKVEVLLKNPHFFEEVLTKIGGKKPEILCKKSAYKKVSLPFFANSLDKQAWKHIFQTTLNGFDNDAQRLTFLDALNGSSIVESPEWVGASTALVKGIKKAQEEFALSQAHFEMLSRDKTMQMIVPHYLYYKTNTEGKGKEFKNSNRVRVEYVITDPKGTILFAHFDNWLDLSQTISGFAHGLRGMKVGESREIFIHPCFAYGAITSLPCLELIAKVKLLDFEENNANNLPSLEPIRLDWLFNSSVISEIEESVDKLPAYRGYFYRQMLEKIEGPNKKLILEQLADLK